MERDKEIDAVDKKSFRKKADYSLLKEIIQRGNTGEGFNIILDDSSYSRMNKLKAGDNCVITVSYTHLTLPTKRIV